MATYRHFEDQLGISPVSTEAYYAEEAWNAALAEAKAAIIETLGSSDSQPEVLIEIINELMSKERKPIDINEIDIDGALKEIDAARRAQSMDM